MRVSRFFLLLQVLEDYNRSNGVGSVAGKMDKQAVVCPIDLEVLSLLIREQIGALGLCFFGRDQERLRLRPIEHMCVDTPVLPCISSP